MTAILLIVMVICFQLGHAGLHLMNEMDDGAPGLDTGAASNGLGALFS